jgi:16S rRNA (uracil1498-N3)-methyltransferase
VTSQAASAPRFFVAAQEPAGAAAGAATSWLAAHAEFDLPEAAARHVMVRRLQPGSGLRLFDGSGVDWPAEVLAIGRPGARAGNRSNDPVRVRVRLGAASVAAAASELPWLVTLAFGMPANDRIDALVEKATELGAAALQPLLTERTVLRLAGERAARRREHWQAIAAAACEQCGRARVPRMHEVRELRAWLHEQAVRRDPGANVLRRVLSTQAAALPWREAWRTVGAATEVVLLSGPEGGFDSDELHAAIAAGFAPLTLGPRILRADTAPLAALSALALGWAAPAGHAPPPDDAPNARSPTPKSG